MAQPVTQAPAAALSRISNPVPIGVAGFALTTFTLGMYTAGIFNPKGMILVFALAAFYGGLTQFIAGFFALARGDLFPAAFMTTYGAFWFTFVALYLFVIPHAGPVAGPQAAGVYLIMWTVITFIFFIASLFTNWVVVIVFAEFVLTLIILDLATLGGMTGLTTVGGYLEMILGALAWFVVAGEIINDVSGRALVPFPVTPFHNLPTVSGEPTAR